MSLVMSCWNLFRPHPYTRLLVTTLAGALALALLARLVFQAPISIVALLAVAAVTPYLVVKFRSDTDRFGLNLALLQLLLIAQLAHFVEHSVQVYQIHVLNIPPREAGGVISALNSEIVHFLWNIGVLTVSCWLYAGGVRGALMLVNIGWALLHSIEHIYMLRNYLLSGGEQGLPGILGRNGWLNTSPLTQNTFLCTLPIATTWIRPDIHFLWNIVEVALLGLAFMAYVRTNRARIDQPIAVSQAAAGAA